MHLIDTMAHQSKIADWNPGLKMFFAMTLILLCISANNGFLSFGVILISSWVTLHLGKIPGKEYFRLMRGPVTFIILGSIAIAFNISKSKTGIFSVNLGFFYVYVTKEGLVSLGLLLMRIYGAVSAMFMMTLSTPSSEIFDVLRKIKVPDLFLELMQMIYRFIFVLTDVHYKMRMAAVSRLGYRDYRTSMLSFGNMASNLFVIALKKGNEVYNAMEARCYDGEMLFLEENKPIKKNQLLLVFGSIIFLMGLWFITARSKLWTL